MRRKVGLVCPGGARSGAHGAAVALTNTLIASVWRLENVDGYVLVTSMKTNDWRRGQPRAERGGAVNHWWSR